MAEDNDRPSDGTEKKGVRSLVFALLEIVAVGIIPSVIYPTYGRFLVSTFPCGGDVNVLDFLIPVPLLWMYFGLRVWRRRGRRKKGLPVPALVGCIISSCVIYFNAFAFEEGKVTNSPPVRSEKKAADSLYHIARAEKSYAHDSGKGFSPSLQALAPYIELGSSAGPGPGYTFQYAASPPDSQGRINGYRLAATPVIPGKTGCNILSMDQSGEIKLERVQLNQVPRAGPH